MRAAKVMGVAPWELAARPDRAYWRDWALAMEAAEADAQRQKNELSGFGGMTECGSELVRL